MSSQISCIIYSPNRKQSCFNLTYHHSFSFICKQCARDVHEMDKVVHYNFQRGNDVSKWLEKYNFSCHSNITKFDTNHFTTQRKENYIWTTAMLVEGTNSRCTWLYNERFASILNFFNPLPFLNLWVKRWLHIWMCSSRICMNTHIKEVDLICTNDSTRILCSR